MTYAYADRVAGMKSSAIREILKVTQSPDVISFAGGLPAPDLFPLRQIQEAINSVLDQGDTSALQYSTTEGHLPLRQHIASHMCRLQVNAAPEEILLTCGSQQALDLVAKLFLNPGDAVAVENPSYLGAVQVFQSYQARLVAVETDEEGITLEALEKTLRRDSPKLLYLTPTFKNPTGTALSAVRRQALAELLGQYETLLVEDDPYSELRYSGKPLPLIKSFDRWNRVVYLSTFSKTVAPGLRLGWIVAERELMTKMVLAKQAMDLHTGTLVQRALYCYLTTSDVAGHIQRIRTEYGKRRDAMLDALRRTIPDGVRWTEPEGGMFLWMTLPPPLNAAFLLREAVEQKVAYVPGSPFFVNGGGDNCLRLNFSNSTPERINEGVGRLARLIRRHLTEG